MTNKIIELVKKGYFVDIQPDVHPGAMYIYLRKYDYETRQWYKVYRMLTYDILELGSRPSINEQMVWVLNDLEEQMKRFKAMVKKEKKNNAEN